MNERALGIQPANERARVLRLLHEFLDASASAPYLLQEGKTGS